MEYHLRLQINPLLTTIVGLDKVLKNYKIKAFNPIENIEQARFCADSIGFPYKEDWDCELICQMIVDFNNATGYIFNDRTPDDIKEERLRIAKAIGHNTKNISSGQVVRKGGS